MIFFENIGSKEFVTSLENLVGQEREGLVKFLKVLSEIERRKVHVEQGYSSLFSFLVKKYGFSEDCAQKRVQASRTCAKFPLALDMIGDGRIHLSGLCALASSLNEQNFEELLSKAAGKTKREIEEMVCYSKPAAKIRDQIKPIGVGPSAIVEPTKTSAAIVISMFLDAPVEVEPDVAEDKIVMFKFSASEKLQKKFERAKEVLWHKCPSGKFEEIFDAALDALLAAKDPEKRMAKKESQKIKKPAQSQKPTRYIKASIKKEVWKRDEGKCVFVSADGHRCESKTAVEFNHRIPWATGGASTVENLEILCRSHNIFHAEQHFPPSQYGEV